jgi:hypothetical protein
MTQARNPAEYEAEKKGPDNQIFRDERTGEIVSVDKRNPGGVNILRPDQTPAPKPDDVAALRKEVNALPAVKNFNTVVPIYQSITESFGKKSRAADLDFVYAIGKIFDPDSVVGEGEMVLVNRTQDLPDQVLGAINRLTGGQALQESTRRELLDVARTRVMNLRGAAEGEMNCYKGIVERNRMPAEDRLPQLGSIPDLPGASAPLPVGGSRNIDGITIERVK